MTFTVNRNVLIFVVLLIALGVGGYVIGTQMGDEPATTTEVATGATVDPAAAQLMFGATAPAPPADTAPRLDMASFKAAFDQNTDMLIVDVRTPDGFAAGHIPGAVNIPEAEAVTRMAEMPKDKRIVLYCA